MRTKRGQVMPKEAGGKLRATLVRHLQVHKDLYGDEHIKPKNHWLLDCADFLEKDTFLFDAFVVERLHLRARAVADNACRLDRFEVTVLQGLVNAQCHAARQQNAGPTLFGKAYELPGVVGCKMARRVEAHGVFVTTEDIVMCCGQFGLVLACLLENQNGFVLVAELPMLRRVTATCVVCQATGAKREIWPLSDIDQCSAWRLADGGTTRVILHM